MVMGATPNVLNFSLVDAQPKSALAKAKSWHLAQKRFFARLIRRGESRTGSAQVESRGLLNLTRKGLFRGSGDQPQCWQKWGESRETAGIPIDGSGDPIRVDETSPAEAGIGSPQLAERVADVCPVCGAPAQTVCHLCGDKFCPAHTYRCPDCSTALCGGCLDSHQAEGHWSDSDTARELSIAITGGAR